MGLGDVACSRCRAGEHPPRARWSDILYLHGRMKHPCLA